VDQDGDVIDILVQPHRDQRAAERFFRRLLRGQNLKRSMGFLPTSSRRLKCATNSRAAVRNEFSPNAVCHSVILVAVKASEVIQHISAVTFAVRDMARSIEFYEKLGFELLYGGGDAGFSSLKASEAFVNLVGTSEYEPRWWGRIIFRVDGVDAQYRLLREQGLKPEVPRDASWGERFFHITDPDGHELSFAELLDERA
jgi:catechol 2,3-dioxygenase-like lactoylglutathione lyase family enzyme